MINSSNSEYVIVTDAEVSSMMAHFGSELILSIVTESLNMRVSNYMKFIPNHALSYESYIKEQLQVYSMYSDVIKANSENVYNNIIFTLADFYNLEINIYNDGKSLSSPAIHLYDLLVSKFQFNLVKFFETFIIREADNLYDQLNLVQYKKNKDSNTIYNKKLWKNSKLSLICSNLEKVLDSICYFDISFEDFINIVYCDNRVIGDYILSIVNPKVDFFKTYIAPWILNSEYRSPLITEIRLSLQNSIPQESYDNQINSLKGE